MASLREVKDRIGSVRSTLKITSAMKLVASAKLRKAQKAIEGMRPYERTLAEILAAIGPVRPAAASASPTFVGLTGESRTAIVAIASNSSLCGGFNANAIRKALETIRACEGEVEVYPVGRKMADGLKRAGYTAAGDWNELIAHPSYEQSAALARSLSDRFLAGELSRVVLVYNRFRSASSQEPVAETYLPFAEIPGQAGNDNGVAGNDNGVVGNDNGVAGNDNRQAGIPDHVGDDRVDDGVKYILEPDAGTLLASLLPQVQMLKFHAAILDSAAAEHAARTIAMQTASDNAEDLLGELTLEYNKGRQQKITAEILDLLGGAQ